MNPCPFCAIVNHQQEANIYYEDESVLAFQDTRPIAPVHILVIPKRHIDSLNHILSEDEALIGHMMRIGKEMAMQFGVEQSGYRLVLNTGADAGQSVFHLHLHVIGGRHLPFKFE